MLFPVYVFAETFGDSLGTTGKQVAGWLSSVGFEHATELVSTLSLVLGWLLTRVFTWAAKKLPTTWYWNDKTQKFAVGKAFLILSKLFGNRVLYYNPKFEGNPDIAEEQKKKIIQEYLQQHSADIKVEVK
jgi:hypothetical protein